MKTKTKNIIILVCSFLVAAHLTMGTIANMLLQDKYVEVFMEVTGEGPLVLLSLILFGLALLTPLLYWLLRVEGKPS